MGWRDELSALGAGRVPGRGARSAGLLPGARPTDVGDYAPDHLVGDVLALADSMEMETFDLVGHDWGGMVAWITAARHPERVRSLGVVSTPHPLALRHALLGGTPRGHGEAMASFCAPEIPERLLLGADGSGAGWRGAVGGDRSRRRGRRTCTWRR